MKRFLLYFTVLLFSYGNILADITISVPKKWKNKTIYVWQTDINQVFNRNAVTRLELPWVSLYQPEESSVTKDYGVTAFPTKVVVNPEGKIQKIYSGASPSFKEDIDNWLKTTTE